jgi:hypothetical protein
MSKSYTVTGTTKVLGHEPGSSFTADLPEDQEAFLIQIGALAEGSQRGGGKKPLKDLSREELDGLARATAGVPEPEKLPNKDAVIEQIEKAAANQKGDE